MHVRFRTGFVLGCATGLYVTRKISQFKGPLGRDERDEASAPEWPYAARGRNGLLISDLNTEKVIALGTLVKERAGDVLLGPIGDIAHGRIVKLFDEGVGSRRARRTSSH
jgi:hypothetical protein